MDKFLDVEMLDKSLHAGMSYTIYLSYILRNSSYVCFCDLRPVSFITVGVKRKNRKVARYPLDI